MSLSPSRVLDAEPVTSLADYEAGGGGEAFALAARSEPRAVIELLEASGLRGRGGAGFPTGAKWRSVWSQGDPAVGRRFVVANGAEGEPGTFKDRPILRRNPYRVLEGLLVSAIVLGAEEAYIAVKSSFRQEIEALERAIAEMQAAGWWVDTHVHLVRGPEEYLFGEEKGLLQVIEGDEPLPRVLPPYLHGLFAARPAEGWQATPAMPHARPDGDTPPDRVAPGSNPTLVNNVETLSNVPLVVEHGAAWFRSCGTDESPGTVVCTVSGDTARAGYAEVEMGTPLATVIDQIGGGPAPGHAVKAVLSGVANSVVVGDGTGLPVSYEGFAARDSGLGAAGFLVFHEGRDMVRVAHAVSRFLSVESCGQCPPCKLGSLEVTEMVGRLVDGAAAPQDVDRIASRLRLVTDSNRCYLGRQEQVVVSSLLASFPEDVARLLEGGRSAPVPPITKIVDIVDGTAVLDERQARKRPDWTYEPTD
jgi:NADH-quinone oxidoreductase subunit F